MDAPPFAVRTELGPVEAKLTLTGELDLDGAPRLRAAFDQCLAHTPRRLLVDVWDLSFCDCAGLNILLDAHQRARDVGVGLSVRGARTQVARLFRLTGVDELFTGRGQRLPPRTV